MKVSNASRPVRQSARSWCSDVVRAACLKLIVSAGALSSEPPTLLTEGSMSVLARRSEYLIETYRRKAWCSTRRISIPRPSGMQSSGRHLHSSSSRNSASSDCCGPALASVLYVDPAGAFDLDWQIRILFIVIVGGAGTLEGPLIGTAIYFLKQLAEALITHIFGFHNISY